MTKKKAKTMYVHEIVSLWSDNGEIYMQTDTDDLIVINGDNFFNEIPHLMTLSLKERRKQEELTVESIESGLKEMKKKLIEDS